MSLARIKLLKLVQPYYAMNLSCGTELSREHLVSLILLCGQKLRNTPISGVGFRGQGFVFQDLGLGW